MSSLAEPIHSKAVVSFSQGENPSKDVSEEALGQALGTRDGASYLELFGFLTEVFPWGRGFGVRI